MKPITTQAFLLINILCLLVAGSIGYLLPRTLTTASLATQRNEYRLDGVATFSYANGMHLATDAYGGSIPSPESPTVISINFEPIVFGTVDGASSAIKLQQVFPQSVDESLEDMARNELAWADIKNVQTLTNPQGVEYVQVDSTKPNFLGDWDSTDYFFSAGSYTYWLVQQMPSTEQIDEEMQNIINSVTK